MLAYYLQANEKYQKLIESTVIFASTNQIATRYL